MKQFHIGQVTSSFLLEWGLVRLFLYIALAKLSYALFSLPSETVLPEATSSTIDSFYSLTSKKSFLYVTSALLLTTFILVVPVEAKFIRERTNTLRKISLVVSKTSLFVFSLYGVPASIALGAIFSRVSPRSLEGAYFWVIAILFFVVAFFLWVAQKLSEATESRMLLITTFSNNGSMPESEFRELCYRRYFELLAPSRRFTSSAEAETVDAGTYILIAGYDKPFADWPTEDREGFLLFVSALEPELASSGISVRLSDPAEPNNSFKPTPLRGAA